MILYLLTLAACLVIFAFSLCELNGMSRQTSHVLRAAFVLMAVGAFGVLTEPAAIGADDRWAGAALALGVALHMLAHRRHEAIRLLNSWWRSLSGPVTK
ncbi:hypothetical protein [Parvibaculum sp.]|jgi:hypothetical protein|uniref:hypothetical protein n=1 Tax=Parvibaculum sp. TaxID=2024848 RepID=UPI002735AC16|nr:hypothetical protein [Parvibaculum sp.]MDP3327225.1 hypothetical protein [Parvibaculum sp.]